MMRKSRQSSIVVAVRVRPFSPEEKAFLVSEKGSDKRYSLNMGDSNLVVPRSSLGPDEDESGKQAARPPAMGDLVEYGRW